jgi:hypothetical protein
MNKDATEIGLFISKATCVVLALILGTSLFVAGAYAELGCGENCCCHRSTMDMHHSKEKRVNLSVGFCNGNPMIPCDIETGQSSQLPDFILFSVGADQPNTAPPTGTNTDFVIDRYDSRAIYQYQSVRENSPSAPIYLQISSFII